MGFAALWNLPCKAAGVAWRAFREYTDRISGAKAKRPGLDQLPADARQLIEHFKGVPGGAGGAIGL